ncbi:arf-GAP domain and FG repeat-containing protein 2 isoform X2 [Esox lucius]|uniref:Arf-GAP domain-containing protein n=1 Tax=Esox lucius TaxID=8010 RepID=A0A3P8YSS3_ESOLU|nr:arf-GAP domain and FG repeat-containing protein 2 isoform X2 [Esox lucius]
MSNRKHRDNQEMCARKVRELAQAGVNKHCFECSQPGVTYIDITVGCFVCTSCSGMLRGLNPPHRVKSISMTTFSQQEVEFLQNHGNEVGRRTWLCAFDPKTDGCFDKRDSQKLKEFLQDKYEKKKWHFSKNKNRKGLEGPWSPQGIQTLPPSHGPMAAQPPPQSMTSSARTTRALPQSQLSSWGDRVPTISPADMRADVFTARAPSRSQSFRDAPMKDSLMSGIERQRPGSLSSTLGPQSHAPPFPALPRPSGRSVLSSGGCGSFRAFPKSLSVDFGGLSQQHSQSALSIAPPTPATAPGPNMQTQHQDRYAALSQLDSVFSDTSPGNVTGPGTGTVTGPGSRATAPPDGLPQYSTLFGNRLSASSTPASSPGVDIGSGTQTFANFPNPFSTSSSCQQQQPALSPSNPFNSSTSGDDCSGFINSSAPNTFPAPATQNAFPHKQTNNQEANGFAPFPAPNSQPKVPRPMSVNPFTGNVYPSRGTSRNPFI